MTPEDISEQVIEIRRAAMANDFEKAHVLEDKLRAQFIAYVATLPIQSLAAKAQMVARTATIEFSRVCA